MTHFKKKQNCNLPVRRKKPVKRRPSLSAFRSLEAEQEPKQATTKCQDVNVVDAAARSSSGTNARANGAQRTDVANRDVHLDHEGDHAALKKRHAADEEEAAQEDNQGHDIVMGTRADITKLLPDMAKTGPG